MKKSKESKNTQEQNVKTDEAWKTMDLESYAKGNIELALTFLRMILNTPAIFAAVVSAMEDHRTSLIQLEADKAQLQKAEIEAELAKAIKPNV